jgi:hypothetical protein
LRRGRFESLESRQVMATFSVTSIVATLDLNVPNQVMTITSSGTSYTFKLSGGATNTWSGSNGFGFAGNGTDTLTANATGLSNVGFLNINDSANNTSVIFANSAANAYGDTFTLRLDSNSNAVLFNGTTSFSGSSALTIITDGRVELPSASCLTMANGNLRMDINTQAVPQVRNFSGLMVNNATIQTTGTGTTNITSRGGIGAAASNLNKGIAVIAGGRILGGTTGTMNLTGYGYTGVDGVVQGQGVFVYNANTSANTSTIGSIGANVSVTGYGANSTNATLSSVACMTNAGVVVGWPAISGGTHCGTITSGGNGTVTVTGYGGSLVSPSASQNHFSLGVYVNGSNAMITSGGAGLVTVLGNGGGADANTACGMGVQVFCGTITSGTNGSVVVNGTGCTTACSSSNWGVWLQGTARIAAGAGTGSTTVTGTGGGCGTAGFNDGVCLTSNGTITATGSGSVTVTGYGGTAGTGDTNRGINLSSNGTITSNGGSVSITGYGGGSGSSASNHGVASASGGTISAGGTASVAVVGYGGNNNGTGGTNYGVNIDSGGSGGAPGYVTSGGGNVVVMGTGGGGTADSPSASSSANNVGVFVNRGGFITAGVSGTVDVTGYGGGRSPGATGSQNYGVQVATANTTTANTAAFSCISSGGGAVNVTGFGGGGSGTANASSSAYNTGVYVNQGGKISSGGNGDVTVNGTGGGFGSSASTGGVNIGVLIDTQQTITGLGETFSTVISGGNGNVTINGQGGGSGSGGNQWGVGLQSGGLITSGGMGNVSITGVAGKTSGNQNVGVWVQCTTTSNVSTTVTSGGGNVVVNGTGGGENSQFNIGVVVSDGAIVIAPGTASVSVTGRGGNANSTSGSGTQAHGVWVYGSGSKQIRPKITSNNGPVTVTGYGGNTNTTLTSSAGSHHGVNISNGGEISSGGTAPLTVTGYGGGLTLGGNTNNVGVFVTTLGPGNLPAQITSNGPMTVSGYGGGTNSNGSGLNYGVSIGGGGQIKATGSGNSLTISGTGGGGNSTASSHGMQISGCTTLSNLTIFSNGGPILLNATEGTGSFTRGIVTTGNAVIGNATTPGDITVLTNSAEFSSQTGAAINAAGSLLIAPITPGVAVNLGSTTDSTGGPLNLRNTELNTFNAGTIQIGNSSTGNFTVVANVTVPAAANLTLVSNSSSSTGIASYATLTMGAGKSLNISALPAVNTSILGTTALSQYSQVKVAGDLSIAGKTLNLSGSYTPTGGDVFTIANATSLTGTFTGLPDGSTTTFNGRTLLVNYTPTTVTLTDPAPLVTTQPTSSAVTAGATASFSAAGSGTPTPTVKWQVSSNGGVDWTDISGATSTTYSFSATSADNANQYRAVFTNTYGTANSDAATLTVNAAPAITTQPTNQTAAPGSTATFTAAASGTPTPTVKWQVDTGSGFSDIAGATSMTYTTGTLSSAENGYQYRAIFTNGIGSDATTNSATLTVSSGSVAPAITSHPANATVTAGATASFSAAASGNPTPTVKWQVSSNGGTSWSDISGETATTLSFAAAAGDHGKQYRAIFTNGVGSDATTSAATLTVNVPPAITSGNSATFAAGLNESFQVVATGNPAVTYSITSGALPSGITLNPTTGSLSGVSALGTAGVYAVTISASNGVGTAATQAFTLTVVNQITSIQVSRGQAQRSYLRYIDLAMSGTSAATQLSSNSSTRMKLIKSDLNGNNPSDMSLAGFVSASGSTVTIDFGSAGIGGSRNTNQADGYYALQLDLDGNGTFETTYNFYRLLGDTNGDGKVDQTDFNNVSAGMSAYSVENDMNGDGRINTTDLLYVRRALNRIVNPSLPLG